MTVSRDAVGPSKAGKNAGESTMRKTSQKKLWIWRALIFVLPIFVIVGAIGAFIAMGALKPTPEEKEDVVKAIPVLTTLAVQEDVTLEINIQGEVQPRTQINLVPQVSGLITYMSPKFIEGGRFNKGDLLVRIEPAEFELRVTQAKANVAQAETVIAREKSEAAIALLDWKDLGQKGDPTPLTLREPQMAEAHAQLASAKARLAEAELQLARTSLYAPFTGRVTMRQVDQGAFVSVGTPLGEIYSTNVMDVRLPMTHEELRRAGLSLGFEASGGTSGLPVKLFTTVAGQYCEWPGHIVRTDSRFDSQTRVLHAYVEILDPFGANASNGIPLAPGLFVNAAVEGQKLDSVIVIPRSALRGNDKVYVADGGTLSIKTVEVLSSNRDQAMLGGGIDIGESVITSPIRGAADGIKIEVVTQTGETTP